MSLLENYADFRDVIFVYCAVAMFGLSGCVTPATYANLKQRAYTYTVTTVPRKAVVAPNGDIALEMVSVKDLSDETTLSANKSHYIYRAGGSLWPSEYSGTATTSVISTKETFPWRLSKMGLPDAFSQGHSYSLLPIANAKTKEIPYSVDNKKISLQFAVDARRDHYAFWFYPAQIILIPAAAVDVVLSPFYLYVYLSLRHSPL